MIKTIRFQDVEVPVPGFGAMGISFALGNNLSYEEAEPVLLKALELGCTFWDTAVSYRNGVNEQVLGDFIRKHNCRDKIFLASKCGVAVFEDGNVTNTAAHIHEYIEGSIQRLGFAPDLYYLHRMDTTTPLEESIGALDALRKAGKTKYIGLSECSASTLRKANSDDGLIPTARELDIAFVAYGPLGHGWLVDDFPFQHPQDFHEEDYRRQVPKFQGENFYANKKIAENFKKLAQAKGCSVTQVALAWVAAEGIIAIPGTTKPGRLEENWASRDVEITDEDRKEMRAIIQASKPQGDRYSKEAAKAIGN